jgi:hypothetical protein
MESEVWRSPRPIQLNDGYRNHVNYKDKHCLSCNAAPPIINAKIVKNLATSRCKVDEEGMDKKMMKKRKTWWWNHEGSRASEDSSTQRGIS